MKLLKSYLISNVKRMNDNNIRMAYIGRTHELPSEVQDTMQWASEQTAKNTGTTLTLALNYGSFRDRRRRPNPRPQAASPKPTSAASRSKTC
jgi:undecaprenyl diphosphate synthase